jgi:hypothetical protein
MDLDELLQHYFGTSEIAGLDEAAIDRARERLSIDFGTEREPGRRFALWTLLHAIGAAPDPALAFGNPAERKAAEDYALAAERIGRR